MEFDPNFKGHFLVVGNTGMGKGVFVSAVARSYQARNVPVFLLTCKEDEYHTFPADFKTMDQDRYLEEVMKFKGSIKKGESEQAVGLVAIIDEAWQWTWKRKLEAIANAGRSRGIEMWVQGTRMVQMPPNVRGNCENIVCFRQKLQSDIDELEKDRGEAFGIAKNLEPGKFISEIEDEVSGGTAWEKQNGKFVSI